MSILEEYDERMQIKPLTVEEILNRVELAEACLTSPAVGDPRLHTERVLAWLHDRLQDAYSAMETARDVPQFHRCAWCWRAGPMTSASWDALPTMTLDEAGDHTQKCEHNPLVAKIRTMEALMEEHGFRTGEAGPGRLAELAAQNEDLRGRALGIDDGLRDAIRALLRSEAPAGELRRALWELVR